MNTQRPIKMERLQPLLTEEIRARLPQLYATESLGMQAVAQVKFFTPDADWTWYASEGSPVDADGYYDTDKEKVDFFFFGLIIGHEVELGYFALSELEAARGPLGLPIERDEWFKPTTLAKLEELHKRSRSGGVAGRRQGGWPSSRNASPLISS